MTNVRLAKLALGALIVLAIPALLVAGWFFFLAGKSGHATAAGPPAPAAEGAPRPARLDEDTLSIPPEVMRTLGVRTAEARRPSRPRALPPLAGTLALDSNRLARVHSRFGGEVVALGTLGGKESAAGEPDPRGKDRPLRFGDKVRKGQLLAVVWSKDLGEKKSDLVDALVQLNLDQENLDHLEALYRDGNTSEAVVRAARRAVSGSRNAANKAERTLRSWRLSESEIQAIRAEARRLGRKGAAGGADAARWARVEVRAPLGGVILEKNVAIGDIVDTSADLFKVADTRRLIVWAHVQEEDLPSLQKLPRPAPWTVRLSASGADHKGALEQIGELIDPTQHTALVTGSVANPAGELRAGQAVTVTLEWPPAEGQVEVPAGALVEDGRESVLFVQPDPAQNKFVRKRVSVARRFHDVVYLHERVPSGGSAGGPGALPVSPGERVVSAGAIFFKEALEELPLPARR